MSSFWNDDEKVEALKKLWADGLTATQVGKKLGCSRNSVLSKVHRLGLSKIGITRPTAAEQRRKFLDGENSRRREKRAAKAPAVPTIPALRFGTHPGGPSEPKEPTIIPEAIVEMRDVFPRLDGLPRTLVDRAHHQCGFPIGDPRNPDFHYCTNEALEIAPNVRATYCRDHMKVAYQPAQVRQRENKRASTIARGAR